jgi:hypothetical protein
MKEGASEATTSCLSTTNAVSRNAVEVCVVGVLASEVFAGLPPPPLAGRDLQSTEGA